MLLSAEFLRIASESQLIRSDVHSMPAAVERKLVGLLNVELRFATASSGSEESDSTGHHVT
jgi:hypothetical protein